MISLLFGAQVIDRFLRLGFSLFEAKPGTRIGSVHVQSITRGRFPSLFVNER